MRPLKGRGAAPIPPRPNPNAESRRLQHLEDLLLGPHDTQVSSGFYGPDLISVDERVHEKRLSAGGLTIRMDIGLGEKPVPCPRPLPEGRLERVPQVHPAWFVREQFDRPFLFPERFLLSTDVFDFQVGARSARLRTAAEAIAREVPDLNVLAPAELLLPPLERSLLEQMRQIEKLPYPHLFGGRTDRLEESGLLEHALMTLVHSKEKNGLIDLADLRASGAAGSALADALREAIPVQRGLQGVLHRARLPIEPLGPEIPLTREEAEACRSTAPELLDEMVRLAPIPKTLPMIEVAKSLVPDSHFSQCECVAVQHVLSTNVTLFDALADKGLDPSRTEIIGVPYSTNYVVEHALRQRGYTIHTPELLDPSEIEKAYERAIGPAVTRALARSIENGQPILLIDDGGKLTSYVAKHCPEHAHRFKAVEQTTRGITELKKLERVPMSVVDVARSLLKRHEMPKIGSEIAAAVQSLTHTIGLEGVCSRPSLVLGCGPVGLGLALALRHRGSQVTMWDPDPVQRAIARRAGFDVPDDRAEALRGKGLVIGASGHRSLSRADFELLEHECVVASASSRDIEIDLSPNKEREVEVVPLLTAGRGDRRFVTRVWRFKEKDIVVLRSGFPINFNGDFETGTAESIQQTRAIMLLGAAQALGDFQPGLHPLGLECQRAFATKAGVELPGG